MVELFKKLFLVRGTVSREFYVAAGFLLMLLKYAVEAVVIGLLQDQFYSPASFLVPSIAYKQPLLAGLPEWVGWAWIVFSIPFMWIALNLSVRRAIDAGVSPWFGMAVLIPVFNFFAMLVLCLFPSDFVEAPARNVAKTDPIKKPDGKKPANEVNSGEESLKTAESTMAVASLFGIGAGMAICLILTAFSVLIMESYGVALFFGMPLLSGTVAGMVYNRPFNRGVVESGTVGLLAVVLGGISLLMFGIEGVICLVMASPLILPLGALGGIFGYCIANAGRRGSRPIYGALLIVPLATVLEPEPTATYVVSTSVEISADPESIWDTVIAFPKIEESPGSYFEYGIAYPINARIEGQGVGAIRYCEFTTGSFVEPITLWQPPFRLAFDVTEQPEPMVELTPYRHLHPPHLDHSFRAIRGEFQLIPMPNGKTRLKGRTWYQLDIGPELYWKLLSDKILHDIHLRVLNHIKRVSER